MSGTIDRRGFCASGAAMLLAPQIAAAQTEGGDAQARLVHATQVLETLAALGEPVPDWRSILTREETLAGRADAATRLLDARTLLIATLSPEARVATTRGAAVPELVEQGWRLFLVRVDNPAMVPGRIGVTSPEARPPFAKAHPADHVWANEPDPAERVAPADIAARWLEIEMLDDARLPARLDALPVQYVVLQLLAREAGRRAARFSVDLGPGTADLGGRASTTVTFLARPSRDVALTIRDVDGADRLAALTIVDAAGRVYPAQAKRRAPDFFFQRHVYRQTGETLRLPTGPYEVTAARGPEYEAVTQPLGVPDQGAARFEVTLERWIDPAARGWYSGDHHLHAAGCAHYAEPEQGVGPEPMFRQVAGEALAVGSVLTWGPGYYVQKRHFSGRDDPVSTVATKLHYDLEISMFPSSACGHLFLLGLTEQDYPGARRIEDWPSWTGPILRWAKAQGAITGYPHAGNGLWANTTTLPNLVMPPFDGIGANEFIATVADGLVDLLGVGDTVPAAELNIWYHTLNAGLTPRIAGETDWPCIYDQAIGMARSYVKVDGALSYGAWLAGLRAGRSYVSDGRAHLIDVAARAGGAAVPLGGTLALDTGAVVELTAQVAARLAPTPTPETERIRTADTTVKPHWHVERARLGTTRQVSVELLVNGQPVETRVVPADGVLRPIAFTFRAERSCWIALRIPDAAHSNPIWVGVAGKPVRVRASAEWCAAAVDRCWAMKHSRFRAAEQEEARRLYDRARALYRARATEAAA